MINDPCLETDLPPLSKRFLQGVAWNVFGKIIVFGSGLLISIALARGLGPRKLGIYATLITIAAVFRLFCNLGLEKILNVKLPSFAVQDEGKARIRFLVSRIILLRGVTVVLVSFLLWGVYPTVVRFLGRSELISYSFPLFLYFSVSIFISILYMLHQSLLKIKTVALVDGVEKIGILVFLTIFFAMGLGIQGALFAYVISGSIVACILVFLGRDLIWGTKEKGNTGDLIKIGFTSVVYGFVSVGLGSQIDIILMNWFHIDSGDIGFYHLGFNLAVMLGLFSQGIGGISQSVFSEAYARNEPDRLGVAWQMITKVFVLMAIPFYIFALFYAPSIFKVFYGSEYLNASDILRVFVLSITIRIIVGSSFCMSAFYLLNLKRKGLSIQILGGIMNLVLDLILIPLYGVWGAVAATAFSLALAGVGQSFVLSRKIGVLPPFLFTGKIILACLLAMIPTLLIKLSSIYALLMAGILYGVTFLITMTILKPLGKEEKEMVRIVNPQLAAVVRYF